MHLSLSPDAGTSLQVAGSVAASFGAYLLAEGPATLERPTPVIVAVAVGVASVFAPGLIREGGEYLRRHQVRQAEREDRDLQGQLDRIKADAEVAKADAARARKHVGVLKQQVADLEAMTRANRDSIAANVTGIRAAQGDAGAARGLSDAGLQVVRDAGLLAATPDAAVVPGTDWPLVLVVEDHPESAAALCRALTLMSYRIVPAATVAAALEVLRTDEPAYIVLDLDLPDGRGEEVATWCRVDKHPARIFVVTGDSDPDLAARLLALGVEAVLVRPIAAADLAGRMRRPAPGGS